MIPALSGAGAKYYCWVHAGESLTAFYGSNDVPDGRDPHETWEVSPYGKPERENLNFKPKAQKVTSWWERGARGSVPLFVSRLCVFF
jgi:hypothetical protein